MSAPSCQKKRNAAKKETTLAQTITLSLRQRFLNLEQVALLAQWLERAAVNRKVTGSIPVGSVFESLAAAKASKNGKIIWFFNIWQAIYIVLVGFMCTPV